ncbi:Hypothetical protein NTJ_12581 [Nesidiocoris tenuis]|uniref:Uncharacterized protein n=1 Tax=Nesidiocoris tenuis TaxID=355587 RepID=A0ABN7B7Z6_9HEMI|nr:Hypothetical protein NTJ_12581 [Nesidiocoris tenuis]
MRSDNFQGDKRRPQDPAEGPRAASRISAPDSAFRPYLCTPYRFERLDSLLLAAPKCRPVGNVLILYYRPHVSADRFERLDSLLSAAPKCRPVRTS